MKKIFLFAIFLGMLSTTYCQQPLNQSDYLKKSKKQKTTARILLYGGLPVFFFAAANSASNLLEKTPGSDAIAAVGLASSLSSIPFFIASKRNKNKALKTTVLLKGENNTTLSQNNIKIRQYPALAIIIHL